MKPTRRRLLQAGACFPAAASAASIKGLTASSPSPLYQSLGIKPVINGVGVVTVLGGSIMPPEVIRAMGGGLALLNATARTGPKSWVRASRRTQCSCRNGNLRCSLGNERLVRLLASRKETRPSSASFPPATGSVQEVIQQKSHRSLEHQDGVVRSQDCHGGDPFKKLENAIGERTGMLFFLNKAEHQRPDQIR